MPGRRCAASAGGAGTLAPGIKLWHVVLIEQGVQRTMPMIQWLLQDGEGFKTKGPSSVDACASPGFGSCAAGSTSSRLRA